MSPNGLSIIIVTYNSDKFITDCLNNLKADSFTAESEILVIDNNSIDNTSHILKNYRGRITKIFNPKNIGYGGACNQAFKESCSPYILFMNPDAFPDKDVVKNLVEYMKINPDVGSASSCLLNPDNTIQYSCREFPKPKYIFARILNILFKKLSIRQINSYLMANINHSIDTIVPWVTGAFMLVRRSAFSEIGGFDEKYFLYCEDADLCLKLYSKGWKTAYVPTAGNVLHVHQSLSRKPLLSPKNIKYSIIHVKSLLRFFIKHFKFLNSLK